MNADLKTLIEKAEQGDVEAAVMVGDCYNKGLYTEKDDLEAHKYYLMAANAGHAKSELMVGINFYYGLGVNEDIPQGIKYIQSAADKNVAHAQYILALIYGAGVDKAYLKGDKEIYYLEKAAKLGHPSAQIKLGDAYYLGEGVKADLSKAIFWLCCAYLHINNDTDADKENGKEAEDRIKTLVQAGMPGGWDRIKEMTSKIKREYPHYMVLNKNAESKTNEISNTKNGAKERGGDLAALILFVIIIVLVMIFTN